MALHLVGFYPTAPGFQRRSAESEPYEGEQEFNAAVGIWEMLLFDNAHRQMWFDDSSLFWHYLQRLAATYQTMRQQRQPLRFEVTQDERIHTAIADMVHIPASEGSLAVINVYGQVAHQEMNIGSLAVSLDAAERNDFQRQYR